MAASDWQTVAAQVCGGELPVAKAGSGPALLVLPRENGHPPENAFLELLAASRTVYYPWYPGYHNGGDPAGWEWIANVRDLAIIQRQLAGSLGLARPDVLGVGFGGWVAAELATMAPESIRSLTLIGPMGIRPNEGFTADQFIVSTEEYARTMFNEGSAFDALYTAEPPFEQLESWETDREMTSRIAWKPYMHNRTLPRLLGGVACPALVVWGGGDRVVPASTSQQWSAALPQARVEVLAGAGHAVELELPQAVAALVGGFLKSS